MERKILVAVDGSVYSAHILHYLERLFATQPEIRFHLLAIVPCGSLPPEKEWLDQLELMSMLSPEARRRFATANRYMHAAVARLARNGLGPEQVSTEVRLARAGVAPDLLHVARTGMYDALLIGRRGLGRLEEFFVGSTSAAILEKCQGIPIWLVDGKVDSRRFLVPVDGTSHTLKAVDHLCFILRGNPHAEVTLFHSQAMLAHRPENDPAKVCKGMDLEWCELHLSRPDSHFHGPEQLLLESGFPAGRIHRLETRKGIYPSRQIVRQAMIDDFGTIVMGRRGKEISKGFAGSVSDQVIAMAQDTAIWIAG